MSEGQINTIHQLNRLHQRLTEVEAMVDDMNQEHMDTLQEHMGTLQERLAPLEEVVYALNKKHMDSIHQLDSIHQHLDYLERDVYQQKRVNRWWKIAETTAIAALTAILLLGATGNMAVEEIRARRFVLIDEHGAFRAILGHANLTELRTGTTIKRSTSSLVLFDKDGKTIWQAP